MNRRQLLRGALGLGALPALISTAWASGSATEQKAALSQAFQRAIEREVPLVVLVIPADDGDKWLRGQVLGEWLVAADPQSLAQLAQVEVVCASQSDLRRLVPGVGAQDAWFVVVSSKGGVEATEISVSLPPPPPAEPHHGEQGYYGQANEDWAALKVSGNSLAIQAALFPVIQAKAQAVPPGRVAELAATARAALVQAAPAGTHWASAGGCGTHIEGVESQMMIGCGMGHVPAASRRFLYFNDVAPYTGQ